MTTTHILKTLATVWDVVAAGKKSWEARRNDRFFQSGDIVVLRKIELGRYAGGFIYPMIDGKYADLTFRIGWMLQGGQFGIEPDYCVFSLEPIKPAKTLYWTEPDCEPTEDVTDLLIDVESWGVSPAIHSNVSPHTRWAVRVPIGDVDEEGFSVLEGHEVEWFESPREAEDYARRMQEPEPKTDASDGENDDD
jgi:hypothetical protein